MYQILHEPPNLQACSVCQSPLSAPHPLVVFQAKVCMGSISPKIVNPQVSAFALLKAEWWEAKKECVGKLE